LFETKNVAIIGKRNGVRRAGQDGWWWYTNKMALKEMASKRSFGEFREFFGNLK